jgi:hypothetical protein
MVVTEEVVGQHRRRGHALGEDTHGANQCLKHGNCDRVNCNC